MIIPRASETEWMGLLVGLPSWEPDPKHTIVIAPHPDDETLGAGGLVAALRSADIEVTFVAVRRRKCLPGTSGLGEIREPEQTEALARLGVDPSHICRLRLPDSGVSDYEPHLMDTLLSIVHSGSQIIAPWQHDFDPDHEASGDLQAFLNVLAQYVSVRVEELDQEKLTPLLRLGIATPSPTTSAEVLISTSTLPNGQFTYTGRIER